MLILSSQGRVYNLAHIKEISVKQTYTEGNSKQYVICGRIDDKRDILSVHEDENEARAQLDAFLTAYECDEKTFEFIDKFYEDNFHLKRKVKERVEKIKED